METNNVKQGKTAAIIAYFFGIGLIIAFIINSDKKNSFTAFHIRQSLGLILLGIVLSIFLKIIGVPVLSWILNLGIVVLWILGLISAIEGEEKTVPLLGIQFQEWFKGIG